jgi:hypothetical protein
MDIQGAFYFRKFDPFNKKFVILFWCMADGEWFMIRKPSARGGKP